MTTKAQATRQKSASPTTSNYTVSAQQKKQTAKWKCRL